MMPQYVLFGIRKLSLTPSLLKERDDCDLVAIRVSKNEKY